jgi:hypothetical protein
MLNKYDATDETLTSEIVEWNFYFDNVAGIVVLFGNDQYMFEVTVMANADATNVNLAGDADSVTLSNLYTCTTIAFTADGDNANLLEMGTDFGTNLATTKYDMAAITDGTY